MKISDKTLALIGFLVPLVAYVGIFSAINNAPWFSWTQNALSDLGNSQVHPESAPYFNMGLMTTGILVTIFAIGIYSHMRNIVEKIGVILFILSGISLFGIGFFPEHVKPWHYIFSVAFFVLFGFALLVIGMGFLIAKRDMFLGVFGLIVGIADATIWIAIPWRSLGVTGVAIPEFLSSLFGVIWIVIYSIKLAKRTRVLLQG